MSAPTSVYRYYDEHGVLLYVGITSRGIARNMEHNKSKQWWQYVTKQEVEHFPTRRAAEVREKDLIVSRRPPFNVAHNPDSGALRDAYQKMRATASLVGQVATAGAIPPGRTPLTILPAFNPLMVSLSLSEQDAPEGLDSADMSNLRLSSGGRKAKIQDAQWVPGSLRLDIYTRDANDCIGAYAMFRNPAKRGERPTFKLIELLFLERGK